jgi:hypothetical protein
MSSVSSPAALPIATHVSLRGQRAAESRAAEAAGQLGTPVLDQARAEQQALDASPDALRAIGDQHASRQVYALTASGELVLRGANAQAAALLRWTL